MKFRSLHIKLAAVFGLCFLIIIGGLIAYGVVSAKQTERFIVGFSKASISDAAKEQLLEKAKNIGLHVRRELEIASDASRILADVLAGIKDETVGLKADRSRISVMLRSVLMKTKCLSEFIPDGSRMRLIIWTMFMSAPKGMIKAVALFRTGAEMTAEISHLSL
ncbi:MAG: hypothetical protein HC887_08615 [Desulfobacteraceae bacterium]|nr:hypothetical protein [Desulfobacteraceae bacterium]